MAFRLSRLGSFNQRYARRFRSWPPREHLRRLYRPFEGKPIHVQENIFNRDTNRAAPKRLARRVFRVNSNLFI